MANTTQAEVTLTGEQWKRLVLWGESPEVVLGADHPHLADVIAAVSK